MDNVYENFFQGEDKLVENPAPPTHAAPKAWNDLILVRRVQEDNSKVGTFIVPEKFRQQSNRGEVVSFGSWVDDINPGDIVTFGVYNCEPASVNGEELLLIREADIRMVEKCLSV